MIFYYIINLLQRRKKNLCLACILDLFITTLAVVWCFLIFLPESLEISLNSNYICPTLISKVSGSLFFLYLICHPLVIVCSSRSITPSYCSANTGAYRFSTVWLVGTFWVFVHSFLSIFLQYGRLRLLINFVWGNISFV